MENHPKKSNWGKKDANLIIKLREQVLQARKHAGFSDCFHGDVKLNLIIFAPNITDMKYKQTGDDDPKRIVGDLDSLVADICEYLQPAPTDPTLTINPIFDGKNEIAPSIALIIENDSQIVKINAKKVFDEVLHYHVEIESI